VRVAGFGGGGALGVFNLEVIQTNNKYSYLLLISLQSKLCSEQMFYNRIEYLLKF